MVLGWKASGAARGRVGVAIDTDGFALVHLMDGDDRPALEVCEYVKFDGPDEFALALSGAVREHGLAGVPATAVLPSDAYVVRPIDAPDVPDDELREATRWALRDELDFDPVHAVVDCLPLPVEGPDASRSMFAVAARAELIDQVVETLRESGLEPAAVEIRETALLNLSPVVGDASEGQAFLRLSPKRSRFGVTRGGDLCMARDLVTDLSVLETFSGLESASEEIGPDLENVLLEVQRSLDYFESNFGRVPAQALWVLPSPFELGPFVAHLQDNTQVSVAQIDLANLVDTTVSLPQDLQDKALAAFCAALRRAEGRHLEMWNPQAALSGAPFSGDTLLKASAIFLVGLVGMTLFGSWQNTRTAQTIEAMEAQVAAASARIESIEGARAVGPDESLAVQIAALREARVGKSRMLEALSGGGLGNLTGFSETFETLARLRREDVWLERIALLAGGESISLAGAAMSPEAVPSWLSSLKGEPAFAGKSFRAFELGSPEAGPGVVAFSLGSRREPGDTP